MPSLTRFSRHPVGAALGAGEDDGPLRPRVRAGARRDGRAWPPVSIVSTRCSTRSTVVACGATSTRTGSLRKPWARPDDLGRHGGGEECRLPARVQRGDDLPHRLDEAHVEHAVGLVEDDPAGLVEQDRAVVHQIGQPAGRGDDHVDAARHGADLGAAGHAAEDEERRQPRAAGEAAEGGLDLHRELAGGGEDQRAAGLGRGAAGAAPGAGAGSAARRPRSCRCRSGRCRECRGPPSAARWPAPGSGSGLSKPARTSASVSGAARPNSAK